MPETATSYDVTTDAGKVRLLCQDTDPTNAYFSDREIDAFLSLEAGNVRLAAADALDAIASSETLILKKISQLSGSLVTDGPAVAKALREHAKALREQVAAGVAEEAAISIDGLFDWAEMGVDAFSRREILRNAYLREQA
jgi:hypothetical protein